MRMLGIFLSVCACITQAHAQNVREPRYVQIIGAILDGGWHFAEKTKYDCIKREGNVNVSRSYVRAEKVKGVMIAGTRPDSPAEQAGLTCGDVIVAVNGTAVREAKELQGVVYPLPEGSEVTLVVRRVANGPENEYPIKATLGEPLEMKIKTTTMDRVKELAQKLPVRTREFIDEPFGPLVNMLNTTKFVEKKPGRIEYTCTFAHRGEQDVLPIESPIFFLLGVTDSTDLKKMEERTVRMTADIEEQGIPTLTTIPVYIARRIGMRGTDIEQLFETNKHGSVGVIDGLESSRDNWYNWKRTEIRCFLPEVLSWKVKAKIRRFEYVGFGRR